MKYIKTRDALQAFYYLIAVDGSVRDDEGSARKVAHFGSWPSMAR